MNPFRRVQTLFHKQKLEAEMAEEMRQHVELQMELNIKAGMNPVEARYAALRQFGNVTRIQERAREQRFGVWLEQLGSDCRHAVRSLWRAPLFSLAVVLTLALGIGATVTLVSIVRRAVFPPVPFQEVNRVVLLSDFDTQSGSDWGLTSAQRYVAVRHATKVLTGLAAQRSEPLNLLVGDKPTTRQAAWVTGDFFRVVGVLPELGRTFSPEEYQDGLDSAAMILSHGVWQDEFGGDPGVVGRQVLYGGRLRRVIGVMPAILHAPPRFTWWEIFLPMSDGALEKADLGFGPIWSIGLLAPGTTPEQAQAQLTNLPVPANYPAEYWKQVVPHLTLIKSHYVADQPLLLRLFLGAAACFYAIACTNAANLMLLRVLGRQHELSVRLALGGGRARILRSVLLETVLLAVVGGVSGLGVAYAGSTVLGRAIGSWLPAGTDGLIDRDIVGFTLGLSLATAFMAGLLAAWRGSRAEVGFNLKEAAGTHSASQGTARLRGTLVVLQIALATTLLIGGALMLRTFRQLYQRGVGIDPSGKIAILGNLPTRAVSPEQYIRAADHLLAEVQRLPEVKNAALSQGVPFEGPNLRGASFPAKPGVGKGFYDAPAVSNDYFKTIGLPLLTGHDFTGVRESDPPVVIINDALARRVFPDGNAVGQYLEADFLGKMEIVGVVGDIRTAGPRQPAPAQFYTPFAQRPKNETFLLVVVAELNVAPSAGLFSKLQKLAYEAEPRLAVHIIRLSENFDYSIRTERAGLTVLRTLSGLALGLAAFGMYAIMAYAVAQRRKEFGVRLALGASPGDLLRLVLGAGIRLVFLGVGIGLGVAWALTRYLQSILYETNPHDPVAFALVALLLLCVSLVACWLPARRAARVDPVIALRAE